jgi:transposase-like protein
MKSILDGQTIELPCPHCSRKLTETIGKIKTNPDLTCRSCGKTFSVKADQFRQEIAKLEKSLADLQRTLGRLGK